MRHLRRFNIELFTKLVWRY